jgi:hypothetical protein
MAEAAEKPNGKSAPFGHGSLSSCKPTAPIPSRDQRERLVNIFQQPLASCARVGNPRGLRRLPIGAQVANLPYIRAVEHHSQGGSIRMVLGDPIASNHSTNLAVGLFFCFQYADLDVQLGQSRRVRVSADALLLSKSRKL